MKKTVLLFALVMWPTLSISNFNLADIEQLFKEPNAELTPFSIPSDFYKVEQDRLGPGWRYITYGDKKYNNVIIYSHGHRGRKKSYPNFASGGWKPARNLHEKASWYFNKGVNFYAALRKQTRDLTGEYGRSVEVVEIIHHLTKKIKNIHGSNVKICYVGHSEGGAPVLYTSVFLKGKHVAVSPSSTEYSPYKLTGKEYYELPEYYNRSKNLTILMGEDELEWDKFKKLITVTQKLSHIKTKLFKNFHHADMAANKNLGLVGTAILEGCGFWEN